MDEQRLALFPENGPKAGGPFSPVIVAGGFAFVAGQVGRVPATNESAGDSIEAQTRQVLDNIGLLLRAAGCDYKDVVKANAYLTKPEFFKAFNAIYQEYFPEPRPVRTTVAAALMAADLLVEIDVIAKLPG
jgi:2-iminobutanoate/2-iminopropanoate deaminase